MRSVSPVLRDRSRWWRLPRGDADNATRWRHVKSTFSRSLPSGERQSRRRLVKAERGIWQRRYWEHLVRDDDDLAAHVDYIHFNPVKHGHVARAIDWPYSTFRYVRDGTLPPDWAGGKKLETSFGERT